MDTKNIVIALHTLAPHGPNYPVPVVGTNNRIIDHARFDQKANRHVCRLPYGVWEKEGEGIVKAGTNPTNQWFPLVEAKEEAQPNPPQLSDAEKAGYVVAPTHAPVPDKLPEEVTPGHLTLPEGTDTTHIPEEPPTPHEQLAALNDQRIQMVQTVVPEAGKETPADRVAVDDPDAKLGVQPTPDEQLTKLDDPRVQLVQDVRKDAGEMAPALGEPGSEKVQAEAEIAAAQDAKQTDRHPEAGYAPGNDDAAEADEKGGESDDELARLKDAPNGFRQLRAIAKAEGVEDFEKITKADDMVAAIQLHREQKAKTTASE